MGKRPGPSLAVSISLLVVGLLLGIGALVGIIGSFAGSFTAPAHEMPGTADVRLEAGRYLVFEHTGTSTGAPASFGTRQSVTLDSTTVSVRSPGGSPVPLSDVRSNQTISRGSATYTAAVAFDADFTGRYQVTADGSGRFIVAPPVTESFKDTLPWLGLGGVGGLVSLVGLVLLIVGIVRRSRSKTAAPAAAPLPYQGWNPPPQA